MGKIDGSQVDGNYIYSNSNFHTFGPMGLGSKGRNKGKLEIKQVKAGVYCSIMCLGELITSFCNVLDPFSKFGIWN